MHEHRQRHAHRLHVRLGQQFLVAGKHLWDAILVREGLRAPQVDVRDGHHLGLGDHLKRLRMGPLSDHPGADNANLHSFQSLTSILPSAGLPQPVPRESRKLLLRHTTHLWLPYPCPLEIEYGRDRGRAPEAG